MKYKIPIKRIELLRDNFFEFSFDDKEPDKDFFDSIKNSEELHFIADNYNWDDGAEVLNWIANSKLCDEGTAKLIFWRSEPQDYTSCEKAEDAEYMGEDIFLLLKKIIKNFNEDFYIKAEIAYNPKEDTDINYRDPNEKWEIPKYLKEPTFGIKR